MLKENLGQYRYLLEPTLAIIGVSVIFWSLLNIGSMVVDVLITP